MNLMTSAVDDGWNAGATYEDFMGRWSRSLTEEFVRWLGLPSGGHWLDVGTGTGALAAAICSLAQPRSVVACDPSGPFIESARQGFADSRVRFEVSEIGSLPLREGGYDAVVSGLALNFFPDPVRAMEEQLEALRPGGRVAALVWDYANGMEFLKYFWDAAAAIEPSAAEADEGRRFSICNPDPLTSLFEAAGAVGVRGDSVSIKTVFANFEDYWRPFLGATGPAPNLVSTFSAEQRDALRDELRRRLPTRSGGSIELWARAWAVVGLRG